MQQAPCVCTLPDGHYYNLTGLANELYVYFEQLTFKYICFSRVKYNRCLFPLSSAKQKYKKKNDFFRIKPMKKLIK